MKKDRLVEQDDAFDDLFDLIVNLGPLAGLTVPTDANDILTFTVGDYRALLNLVETSLSVLNPATFTAILNNPAIAGQLDAETIALLQSFAGGDFSELTAGIDEVRALLQPFPDETLLSAALNDGDNSVPAEIDASLVAAQVQLANLLWDNTGDNFFSPFFTIDPDTGIWSVAGNLPGGYDGTTLAEFYATVGSAIGASLFNFIDEDSALLDSIVAAGGTVDNFNAAQLAVQTNAALFFTALQGFAASASSNPGSALGLPTDLILSTYQQLLDAITTNLPGVGTAFDGLTFGSENGESARFFASFDGGVAGTEAGDWLFLSGLANTIAAAAGADVLFGLAGNDSLDGGADNDVLFGGADNDQITGGAGDDAIDGGEGSGDSALYIGDIDQFTLNFSANGGLSITDRSGAEGVDAVSGIETLNFGAGNLFFETAAIDLGAFGGLASLTAEQIGSLVELYIAYFNRAPDAVGLSFWGTALAGGMDLPTIANFFIDQSETRALYPEDATTLDFVTAVYNNVLGRTPDANGLQFWVDALDNNQIGRGGFILDVLEGARADPGPNDTQEEIDLRLGDNSYLAQKTDIGAYFSVINGMSNVQDANEAMQLFVRGDDSSVQAAVARIEQDFADALTEAGGELLIQIAGVIDDPFAATS